VSPTGTLSASISKSLAYQDLERIASQIEERHERKQQRRMGAAQPYLTITR
jgi:hypothetical protein